MERDSAVGLMPILYTYFPSIEMKESKTFLLVSALHPLPLRSYFLLIFMTFID